jgi:hypothetical protein
MCHSLSVFIAIHLRSIMLLSVIADFLPRRPEFDPKTFHVRFMTETVAVGHVFCLLRFSSVSYHSTKAP